MLLKVLLALTVRWVRLRIITRRQYKSLSKPLVLLLRLASKCCLTTKMELMNLFQLNDGDSLIVAVKPPVQHIQDGLDDDDLKFQLPHSTSGWKRRFFSFLHDKLRLPDMILMAIFSLSLKMWAVIVVWFILAPVAYRWDLGPFIILGTGFTIIFLNLGQRQHGDISAYSIFNEDFREIPGTLNADSLEQRHPNSAYSIFNEDFREIPGTLNADSLDRGIRTGQF
ncbi:hypothetical protein F0562_007991 [Nyssa sinensis]|uniref:SAYSvFN domain-containing protein n=1 Tax=Nyssa sinensis TaxID=561372 RepID=A0A5J5A6L9_9ASTE|nr:hypothetical protein F0562_007991 [Nyssa sinensis]